MCVYPGFCDMKLFENHCFRQSKTAGRQPAFSSSELNTAQHGFDRLSACMLSLWNDRTISRVPGEKKENQCDSCEQIWRWWGSQPCEMQNAFFPSNFVNFEAVIANLIHELCETLSHGKVLCCLSVCRLGVRDDHIWGRKLLSRIVLTSL